MAVKCPRGCIAASPKHMTFAEAERIFKLFRIVRHSRELEEHYARGRADGGMVFTPRVTTNIHSHLPEDEVTPRISVAPTIWACVAGMTSWGIEGLSIADMVDHGAGYPVYGLRELPACYLDHTQLAGKVPDAEWTHEGWVTCPVFMEYVGVVRVPEERTPDGEDLIAFLDPVIER